MASPTFFTAAEGLNMVGLLSLSVRLGHGADELHLVRTHDLRL